MKKLFTILSLALILLFSGCSKDDTNSPEPPKPIKECEKNHTGGITISNTSSNPYDLFMDGQLQDRLPESTIKGYDVPSGTHTFKVVQVSGYLVYPTVREDKIVIRDCVEFTWSIP